MQYEVREKIIFSEDRGYTSTGSILCPDLIWNPVSRAEKLKNLVTPTDWAKIQF
jgi:hypothetical protein